VTQPLHTSQHIKNLGNTRIAYKPRHTHTHTLEARKKPRWQLVTQLLTDQNTQGGPKYQYKYTQTHKSTIRSILNPVYHVLSASYFTQTIEACMWPMTNPLMFRDVGSTAACGVSITFRSNEATTDGTVDFYLV
jgi:hypothetical protein